MTFVEFRPRMLSHPQKAGKIEMSFTQSPTPEKTIRATNTITSIT